MIVQPIVKDSNTAYNHSSNRTPLSDTPITNQTQHQVSNSSSYTHTQNIYHNKNVPHYSKYKHFLIDIDEYINMNQDIRSFTKSDQFNIGTLNIRSEFSKKLSDIFYLMHKEQLMILFINETNLRDRYDDNDRKEFIRENYTFQPTNAKFTIIFNNDKHSNSGCAFIFHNSIVPFIHSINTVPGRLLHISLIFKKTNKFQSRNVIHLLGIYGLQHKTKHKKQYTQVFEYVNNFIDSTPNDQAHIILGDFNININKINRSSHNNINSPWHDCLLHLLLDHNYKDAVALGHNNNKAALHTHFPSPNTGHQPSRIDFIFLNTFFFNSALHYNNKFDSRLSDHALIFCTFNNRFKITYEIIHKNPTSIPIDRIIYKKVDNTMWSKYTTDCNNTFNNKYDPLINHTSQLSHNNYLLTCIEQSILINSKPFPRNYFSDNKDKVDYIERNKEVTIHKIRLLGKKLNSIIKNSSTHSTTYTFKKKDLKYINKGFNYIKRKPNMDTIINLTNIKKNTDNLMDLFNALRRNLQLYKEQTLKNKIEKYIDIRNENFKSNPGKMLDSILNREYKRITLDKLIISNSADDDKEIILDQQIIEIHTIDHFQHIGSNTSPHQRDISDIDSPDNFWHDIYYKEKPSHINTNMLTDTITLHELKDIIKNLPNGKATGPSKISYEHLKHLPDSMMEHLLILFNNILTSNIIPDNWRKATIFPIPKPKPFQGNLSNTRPITLLDCIRKTFVKIINNRLNEYLYKYDMLQHNNRAGIKGNFTMETIAMLQAIADDQRLHPNKPLFIMLQDLSKAYDRVDIPLLGLVLERLHIPFSFRYLIQDLFTERTNNIIMNGYLSQDYEVLQGIDQGETICPLLWVIYYDPMFEAINRSQNKGYEILIRLPKKINDSVNEYITYDFDFKLSGYMDDTTWFDKDINNLSSSLNIADDFYNLAKVKINKDKTILLTNDKSLQNSTIPLSFGSDIIDVKTVGSSQNERILGIYINMNNDTKFTIAKISRCINYTCFLLRKKQISHDMCAYVINKVIIPRIEYWTQHIPIPEYLCKKWDSKIRSLFKYFLSLPKNTINEVFSSHIYFNIPHIFDSLIKNWTAQTIAKINIPSTKKLFEIIILINQMKFHFPTAFPEFLQFYQGRTTNFSLLDFLILKLPRYNLKLDSPISHCINGGFIPIMNYLINIPNLKNTIKSLKKKNIMFFDQVISVDSLYLLSWKEIQFSTGQKVGRPPKWYFYLRDNFTHYLDHNKSLRLTHDINSL